MHDEPLTVRVEERPPCENDPSGWQAQMESPPSSELEQHVRAPLLPLLLLLHAPTSPTNRTTHADVVRFIDPLPFSFDGKLGLASHVPAILARRAHLRQRGRGLPRQLSLLTQECFERLRKLSLPVESACFDRADGHSGRGEIGIGRFA